MANPLVAIVGRPNVGKSSLFNRLAGERLAVVNDTPGTTRDRLIATSDWRGLTFDVMDTGGIDPSTGGPGHKGQPLSLDSAEYIGQIRAQAEYAIHAADAVIFLTEVTAGVTAADHEIAAMLRRRPPLAEGIGGRQAGGRPPVFLAVNRCENEARRLEALAFYELGMGDPHPISALHGIGVGDLLDAVVPALAQADSGEAEQDERVKIAIVGKPNAGKSSLLNRLLGEERAIVSEIPGTTRDAIDTDLEYEHIPITLIDTAGIRRRGKIAPGVEQFSVLRAMGAIRRADVALLVVDALSGVTAQDTHIAGYVLDEMKSVVIVVNKWDALEKDQHTMVEYTRRVRQQLNFLDYVPVLFISALTGQRVDQVLPTALQVQEERLTRISTAELNRLVREAVARHPPPSRAGRQLKILYASQVRTDPPTFLFHVNDPKLVHFTYERYLENRLREVYPFSGTPLRFSFRKRNE
ncbi:MAG: ribosome biogenesis GTPase Der [Chloroflexi bacterium]|nr:ribosome biogenesis GTPase Der [Chloroflexota bacterium]